MNTISTRTKVLGALSVCLWIIGSILLFQEPKGKAISGIVAVIGIAGLYSQMRKDKRQNSEL